MKNDFRDLAATLVNEKLKEYLDKRLATFQSEFKKELNVLKSDVAASTDISLETGSKVDNFMKLFQGAFAGTSVTQKTLTVAPSEAPKPTEHPKIVVSPTLPKVALKEEEPKKGLDALEQVKNALEQEKKEQWAKALERINAEFEIHELEGRMLSFLYECGPQSAHELKKSGLWRSSDSVTYFLEELQADERLVKYLVAEKKWAITNEGIRALREELESAPISLSPVATSDIITQGKTAFKKTEDGLKEALSVAKGEAKPAMVVSPQASMVQAKPALTIVPSGPRILKAVEPISNLKLTYVEKSMVALLQKDMTIGELQKAIGHTSNIKSLANMLYRCEREDGYIQYFYSQGQVYRVTEKGRAYITKVAPDCRTLAAS